MWIISSQSIDFDLYSNGFSDGGPVDIYSHIHIVDNLKAPNPFRLLFLDLIRNDKKKR